LIAVKRLIKNQQPNKDVILKKIQVFIGALFLSSVSIAQSSYDFRSEHNFSVDAVLATASLPIPGSTGVGFNWNVSPQWQLSVDRLSTGVDVNFSKLKLAGFSETRLGLKARRFYGNSFNLTYGYVRRENDVYLEPDLYGFAVTDVKARTEAHADMLHFAIANHWQFNNWTVSVDWLAIELPIGGEVTKSAEDQASSESDKEDIRTAENVLTWYPNIASFNLRLGYMF
jgi:hypothetical protein